MIDEITIYTIGYFMDLALLSFVLHWLVTTNHWTRGKWVITLMVSVQTWNFLWACITILLHDLSLGSVKGLGYQIPTLIVVSVVIYLLRGGDRDEEST